VTTVLLLGLGEVGSVLAEDLTGADIRAWDIAFTEADSRASRNAQRLLPGQEPDAGSGVPGADLVISAVTAASTVAAAESVADGMAEGTWYLDLNSASPHRKQRAAELVTGAGGRYVEAAVMSPIRPKRLAAAILLGGPQATAFAEFAGPFGFTGLEVYADTIGPASATKLCRSVVVKGVEALVTESMLAAREWGVEDRVLDSLSNLFPVPDWTELAGYLISRSVEHGVRRAEEMREAADTVAGTGVEPVMSLAIAERQYQSGAFRDSVESGELTAMLDRIRARTPR
jgi:3-hydroxyisobutyrate dehydrogenase-like beta-hydroxyacid dehydrogenase